MGAQEGGAHTQPVERMCKGLVAGLGFEGWLGVYQEEEEEVNVMARVQKRQALGFE